MSWMKKLTCIFLARYDKSDIIDVDYLDPKAQNLVILDNFVTEKDKKN